MRRRFRLFLEEGMRVPQKMQQPRVSGEVLGALEAPEEEHGGQDQLGVAAEGVAHLLKDHAPHRLPVPVQRAREASHPRGAQGQGEEAVE